MSNKPDKKRRVSLCIRGEPASKANQRKLVTNRNTGKKMFIKSEKARGYVDDFLMQCPRLNPLFEGDVSVTITIYYSTRRPDLDESVILDCMQNQIYKNDRQVKDKHVRWALDKKDPRTLITVEDYTVPDELIIE